MLLRYWLVRLPWPDASTETPVATLVSAMLMMISTFPVWVPEASATATTYLVKASRFRLRLAEVPVPESSSKANCVPVAAS